VLTLSVYRQVVDLASPDTASWVIPGGASGDPESPHFGDQLAEWAEHRRIPMIVRDSAPESGANPAR
jgi:penicillin amidase